MPKWLRIALIIVLVLLLWWLATTLGRGVAQKASDGTGMVLPVEERLLV